MKAAWVSRGSISLSMFKYLPLTLASYIVTPVRLPRGCARLGTKPWPTASAMPMNTIGTVWVSC